MDAVWQTDCDESVHLGDEFENLVSSQSKLCAMSVWSHMAIHSNTSSKVHPVYTDVLTSTALGITCCEYGDPYAIIGNSLKRNDLLRVVTPTNYSQSCSCFCLISCRTGLADLNCMECFNSNWSKQAVTEGSKWQVAAKNWPCFHQLLQGFKAWRSGSAVGSDTEWAFLYSSVLQ